jgi:fimbrial chaperone protein
VLLVFALLLTATPRVALAGGFSVDPIRLELKPSQIATALTVANYNDEPLFLQVRVYRWEHKDHEEVLSEVEGNAAPLITPPLFRLAPGGASQIIRIGFQKAAATPAEERQWRVIVEEVPQPASANAADPAPLSVAVHLRVSLPLFQLPPTVHQDLEWSLQRAAAGGVALTAHNQGSVTERLDDIRLGAADDKNTHVSGPLYLFPGEQRTFALHPSAVLPAGKVELNQQGTPRPLIRELVLSAQ